MYVCKIVKWMIKKILFLKWRRNFKQYLNTPVLIQQFLAT